MSYSYSSAAVTSPKPAEEVFGYLADLRNLPEWDPESSSAEQTSAGEPVSVGATFRVATASRFAKAMTGDFEIVDLEHPRRIVVRGSLNGVDGVDTLTIGPAADGGSEVVYAKEITLRGSARLITPLAGVLVNRSGEKTRKGLERTLNPG